MKFKEKCPHQPVCTASLQPSTVNSIYCISTRIVNSDQTKIINKITQSANQMHWCPNFKLHLKALKRSFCDALYCKNKISFHLDRKKFCMMLHVLNVRGRTASQHWTLDGHATKHLGCLLLDSKLDQHLDRIFLLYYENSSPKCVSKKNM